MKKINNSSNEKIMRNTILTILLLMNLVIYAQQDKYPQDYFRSPIDGRIYPSGTFGELRSNHFHAGLDIKTGGEIGKNIYAVADGYVSRIKISPYGYGHAIYIAHPNGFTSVYGHLSKLLGAHGEYVEQQQYKRQKFAVDLYFKAGQFPVSKGDTIALSGNTGGSGGPHLHFEIRETATQEPINPLLFGLEVKDYITPQIRGLRIYPAEEQSLINGSHNPVSFNLKGWGKDYQLSNSDTITISGDFYTGINTIDKQNDSNNKNGVYQIELWIDSSLFFQQNVERLNFSTTRYINTLIDFDYYKNHQSRYQRTYISPNNRLNIYNKVENDGIISFADSTYHFLQYVVKDIVGNKSVLSFTVFANSTDSIISNQKKASHFYQPLAENHYEDSLIRIDFPIRSLYDTLSFHFYADSNVESSNGLAYHLARVGVGLQKNLFIRLKNINIKPEFANQVFIGEYYKEEIYPNSAEWDDEDLTFKTRDFGTYLIRVDSIPPTLRLKTKLSTQDTVKLRTLDFYVEDTDSGINQYNAWLNGAWILLNWDPKENHMFCEVDLSKRKKNSLKVRITDQVGNVTEKDFIL